MKSYVDVQVRFDERGEVLPMAIIWEDGRAFEIDRILDVRNSVSEAGGAGRRFIVRIGGKVRNLFLAVDYERGGILCWFVERREAERTRQEREEAEGWSI